MTKTNWQDPRTGEIISPHISGLQEAVGKLEESIGIETIAETNIPLSEVFVSNDDRYRIYQAPEGKRNWLLTPTPIIKKNGIIISSDFDIDYGGGAIIFTNPITASDILTADFTHTIKTENILTKQNYASKSEAEVGADNSKVMTPLRVREFFIANGGGSGGVTNVVFQSGKKYYKFTATDVVNSFEIPSELFNPTNDVIELIHGGNIPLIKDENYTLVGNLVTFIGYSLDIGDDIHCLITNTSYSYNALSDKPNLDLKQDKNNDNLNTTSKEIVGAINENKANIDGVTQQLEQKADKAFKVNLPVTNVLDIPFNINNCRYLVGSSVPTNAPASGTGWSIIETKPCTLNRYLELIWFNFGSTPAGNMFSAILDTESKVFITPWKEIATKDYVSLQMEQKADKLFKENGWKIESDLPTTYGRNTCTVFMATSVFGGYASGVIVETTIGANGLGKQTLYRADTQAVKFRLVTTSDTWGAWQTLSTQDKIDSLFEVGTWTPVIKGNSVAGTNVYALQNGSYVKNGKLVTVSFNINLSTKDTAMATAVVISGLPFAPKAKNTHPNVGQILITNMTINANETFFLSARYLNLEINNQLASTTDYLAPSRLNNNTTFRGSITYEID